MQQRLNDAIAECLIDLLPEDWSSAVLNVFRSVKLESEDYAISIVSPEGHTEVIEPDQQLSETVRALVLLLQHEGTEWESAHYQVTREDGAWDYRFAVR